MKTGHAPTRPRPRSLFIDDPDTKFFSTSDSNAEKNRARSTWPVESAAPEEIENWWASALFLDDFHKRLGKHKTLSTLTTGPATIIHLKPYEQGTKNVLACTQP